MRFTLQQNAISSLHIAIENFKDFYESDRAVHYKKTELDEKIKISLVFLENAIELMLKAVLVENDETSIYEKPNLKCIQDARELVDDKNTLADILLKKSNFKTINYYRVIKKFIELTNQKTEKVEKVLLKLSERRNAITHFGIEILDYDEIVLTFINTFDVIFNYLIHSFDSIDEIGDYLTIGDLVVKTVHDGDKWFVSEDGTYPGICDYLDQLLIDHNNYIFALRANNPKTKILEFESLLAESIKDKKFYWLLKNNNSEISLKLSDIEDHELSFEIDMPNTTIEINSIYSMYYNATIFEDDAGDLLFIVLHNENNIYLYKEDVKYPCLTKPENEKQWLEDEKNGYCEKYNLSKGNLIKVFEKIIERYKVK